jgi:hypothetical protein
VPEDQLYEVAVLGHDDRVVLSRSEEDLGVFRVAKTNVPEGDRIDVLGFCEPPGDGGRQLRVDPDLHAARIG